MLLRRSDKFPCIPCKANAYVLTPQHVMPMEGKEYWIDFGEGHFKGNFERFQPDEDNGPHTWLVFDTGEILREVADVFEVVDEGMDN